jgi:histidyl-tRNA synthetase
MVTYEPDLVKGFPEYLPPQSQKYAAIQKVVDEQFQLHGFFPIKTPTVEFDELMRPEVGNEDEAISDRFRLQDRGGRNLGLRYEFTFQLARIFKQHPNIKLPFRRYQIGAVFRDEPTSSNRYKEFVQCDADIIGDASVEADAECLALWSNIMKALGIKAEIRINHRKLANAILESVQITHKAEVMREIDKLDKVGEDVIKANLKKYADTNQIITLFKLLEKDLAFFVSNMFDGAEDIIKLRELGKKHGFTLVFDPLLVRGLSYYTGMVTEFRHIEGKHSIAGGGRYDKSVGKFLNRDIAAVGISASIERLMEYATVPPLGPKAIIISIDKPADAAKLAKNLRNAHIACIVSTDKPGKSLEYANAYQIPNAIFVGSDEVKKKKFKIKNMFSGEEHEYAEKSLIKALQKN